MLQCLNPDARQNRLYWLTNDGVRLQRAFCHKHGRAPPTHDFPDIDWSLYGWTCFRHRSVIVRTLATPMQPATIKRKARLRYPNVRMSANNVRDAVRLLHAKGVTRRQFTAKQKHPQAVLTDECAPFQRLLQQAAWRGGAA